MLARSNGKLATCVPGFSVEKCTNPAAVKGQSFGYSTFFIDANINHVDFDLPSGTFTVKTAQNFQLDFNALVCLSTRKKHHRFDLKFNGETKTVSFNYSSSETSAYQTVVISALVQALSRRWSQVSILCRPLPWAIDFIIFLRFISCWNLDHVFVLSLRTFFVVNPVIKL